MGNEEGIMDRAGPDSGDFEVKKDYYYAVDTACKILHVEKLTDTSYLVQASCYYEGDDPPSVLLITDTSEFEIREIGCALLQQQVLNVYPRTRPLPIDASAMLRDNAVLDEPKIA